jgi:hypothetical protein
MKMRSILLDGPGPWVRCSVPQECAVCKPGKHRHRLDDDANNMSLLCDHPIDLIDKRSGLLWPAQETWCPFCMVELASRVPPPTWKWLP